MGHLDKLGDYFYFGLFRFVAVCSHGHLSEFPWKEWIECNCPNESGLRLIDGGGSDLGSVRVRCDTCPGGSQGAKGRALSKTTKQLSKLSKRGSPPSCVTFCGLTV